MGRSRGYTRREALRWLASVAIGVTASACTPLRILTQSFPADFRRDPRLVEHMLLSFVAAVIPGIDSERPAAIRALLDRRYPFARYAAYFASDLESRAQRQFNEGFDRLTIDQRTAVIAQGLAADGTTRKLYRGAIYLSQLSNYAGFYDDEAGCALIGFRGRFRGSEAISYADPESFLPRPLTATGNA